MNYFGNNASERSMNESTVVTFSTPSVVDETPKKDEKPKKKDKRSKFSVAKMETYNLYQRLKWMLPVISVDKPDDKELPYKQPLTKEEKLFKICLQHVLEVMDGYNELAFKKDLVFRMSPLISDKRFDRYCRRGEWSMFMLSQQIVWCHQDDYDKIIQRGLDHVDGFETYGLPCYRFDDLYPDFKALGYDKSDFNGDPYSEQGKEIWSERENKESM